MENNMKKRLIAIISASMILLTACNNTNTSSESITIPETTESQEITTPSESDTETSETEEKTASQNLADVVLNSIEWPMMGEQTDEVYLYDYFGLDMTKIEEVCAMQNLMSTQLNEIIIIKPSEGNNDDIKTSLEAHLNKLKTELAFYPSQAEAAEAAIVSEYKGYLYLICHTESITAEEALTEAIDNLN